MEWNALIADENIVLPKTSTSNDTDGWDWELSKKWMPKLLHRLISEKPHDYSQFDRIFCGKYKKLEIIYKKTTVKWSV